MSKSIKPIPPLTDDEIRRSRRETLERDRVLPRASHAFYIADDDKIGITLKNEVEVRIPARKIQGLRDATPGQLANITLTASGNALHWEELDVQMSVDGLVAGIFGTQAWMQQFSQDDVAVGLENAASTLGRKGGRAQSAAKAAAVRENGKKGGRPPKSKD